MGFASPLGNNNTVDRNYINGVNQGPFVFGDIGAINTDDSATHAATNNAITNNVILNNGPSNYASLNISAIYLDDYSSNVTVTGNVCQHCGTHALQIHGGDHNTIQNNIFDLSTSGTLMMFYQQEFGATDYGMGSNIFTKNLVYTSGSATGMTLWANQKTSIDANPSVSNNLYYAVGGGTPQNPSQGISDTSPVYANPQFTSPSTGNYSMPSSSPSYTSMGFQPLPTDQGPLPDPTTSGGGVLTGSVSSATNPVDLTVEGTTDWVHWSNGSVIRKAGVTAQISNYTVVGSGAVQYYSNDPRTVSWTAGAPTVTGSDVNGVEIGPSSNGFSITAPAGTSTHTLVIHVGGWVSSGTLTAHLSDGSASDFVDTTPSSNGPFDRNYTLTYTSASTNQTLRVTWQQNGGTSGNVTLSAVALQ